MNFVQHRFRDRFFQILRLRGRILEAFWVHKWPHDASKGGSRAPKWDPGASKIHQKIGLGPPWLPRGGPRGLRGTPPTPKLRKIIKNTIKIEQTMYRNSSHSNANLHSKILWKCILNFTASSFAKLNAKVQWPRRAGRSPLGFGSSVFLWRERSVAWALYGANALCSWKYSSR